MNNEDQAKLDEIEIVSKRAEELNGVRVYNGLKMISESTHVSWLIAKIRELDQLQKDTQANKDGWQRKTEVLHQQNTIAREVLEKTYNKLESGDYGDSMDDITNGLAKMDAIKEDNARP